MRSCGEGRKQDPGIHVRSRIMVHNELRRGLYSCNRVTNAVTTAFNDDIIALPWRVWLSQSSKLAFGFDL